MIDTNLFVAAVKSGKTKSTELLVRLIEGTWDLVADDILISEYERYALKFGANAFFKLVQSRVVVIEQSEEDILLCKSFFPAGSGADAVHAATCLHTGAILISNYAHFDRIKVAGIIEVWSISDAIKKLL
ncbi:MAG: PIN domain-containing protein [Methanothrix sp.]|nr:PIN domain-containing protein [Methanothrix sp.]